MGKIKIFVCCHKPYTGYRDEVYTPIHLGRAVSTCTNQMKDMIGDDTGDNISEKNPYYSEATGIYWIWKNVHDCEYVGLHHYRRFFVEHFTDENIDSFFADGTDVLMARPGYCQGTTRWYHSMMYMSFEDILILRSALKGLYPEYIPTFNHVMNDYTFSFLNMVICRKSLYDEYAKWMFEILFNVEKIIKFSPYPNSQRSLAYMSEILTPIFFIHNNKKIKYQIFSKEGNVVPMDFKRKMYYFITHNIIHPFIKNREFFVEPSVVNGLMRIGIDLSEIEKGKF